MKTVNYKQLKGQALYDCMTSRVFPDQELASIVRMLPYATMDFDKAIELLEQVIQTGRSFVVLYADDTENAAGLEFVGSVIDGTLCIK